MRNFLKRRGPVNRQQLSYFNATATRCDSVLFLFVSSHEKHSRHLLDIFIHSVTAGLHCKWKQITKADKKPNKIKTSNTFQENTGIKDSMQQLNSIKE
jgi:hypothetical protein